MATGGLTRNKVVTDVLSLYIFYCSRSVKDNKNKKRIIKKNKKEEVTRRFCKLIGQKERNTFL